MSFTCNKLLIKDKANTLVDITFSIDNSLALIGESGSGKSLTLKTLLGLTPENLQHELNYDYHTPIKRGENIAIVVQNPFTAFSPLTTIGGHFFIDAQTQATYMSLVQLDPTLLLRYPSELSGGQLQRVVIALALAAKPSILLLDEATTALDTATKYSILTLLKSLHHKLGFLILFVTHDIDAASQLCEDIAIMQHGKIIEEGALKEVLHNPKRDYTKILINSNFKNREMRT